MSKNPSRTVVLVLIFLSVHTSCHADPIPNSSDNPSPAQKRTAQQLFKNGFTLYQQKQYAAAFTSFDKGTDLDATDPDAMRLLGDTAISLGRRMYARQG